MKFLDCKVSKNSKNGQHIIYLPKKAFIKVPDSVKVSVPKDVADNKWFFLKKMKGGVI